MEAALENRRIEFMVTGFINPTWQARDLALPFDLSCGVWIDQIPDWLRQTEFSEDFHLRHRNVARTEGRFLIAARFGALDPDRVDSGAGAGTRSALSVHKEYLALASVAIWVARRSTFGFGAVVVVTEPDGSRRVYETETKDEPVHLSTYPSDVSGADLQMARVYLSRLIELERTGPLWIATATLWTMMLESRGAIRLLHAWIALEALFGPGAFGELKYRITQNLALFVGNTAEEARGLRRRAAKLYDVRSRVAHGDAGILKRTAHELEATVDESELLLQRVLAKILGEPRLTAVFSSAGSAQEFLEVLPYGGSDWHQRTVGGGEG